jgi:hypothetical protein
MRPQPFLIDREGRIAAEHVGLAGKSTYEGQIPRLLTSGNQGGAPLTRSHRSAQTVCSRSFFRDRYFASSFSELKGEAAERA